MSEKRELKRLMDREIKKGSFPLQFERIAFHRDTYRLILSEGKLEEVFNYLFRMGLYKCYEEVTVVNNIYMDYDIIRNECIMRRARSVLERIELRSKMLFRARRLKPDYENGKVVVESIKCYFKVDQKQLDRYKMRRKEIEVYGFPIADLEKEISGQIEELVELKTDITHLIEKLEKPEYRLVLELRYLCMKSWEQISVELGYNNRHVRRMRDEAVCELEEIMKRL